MILSSNNRLRIQAIEQELQAHSTYIISKGIEYGELMERQRWLGWLFEDLEGWKEKLETEPDPTTRSLNAGIIEAFQAFKTKLEANVAKLEAEYGKGGKSPPQL